MIKKNTYQRFEFFLNIFRTLEKNQNSRRISLKNFSRFFFFGKKLNAHCFHHDQERSKMFIMCGGMGAQDRLF